MSDNLPKKPVRKPAAKKAANATGTPPKPRKPRAKPAVAKDTSAAAPKRVVRRKPPVKQSTNGVKVGILGALFFIVLFSATWVYWGLYQHVGLPAQGYRLNVERGQTFAETLNKLDQDGVLPSQTLAKIYLKMVKPKALQTGTYLFKPPLTVLKLLSQLSRGDGLMMNKMTIIEGTTFKQLRTQLVHNVDVKHTLNGKNDSEVLALLGVPETHPEGLFAPDTYIFPPDESDVKILKRLYQQQQHILQKAWANRAPNLPYKTAYDALIMASIVEKETGNKIERPEIAGVFVRRLQQGMRLQTDPTVIYGLGDSYNGNIRKADLLAFTPYNTYRINGLPPTPIALPSKAAIEAAVHPAAGDAVYFVAKGDGSGTHNFSATLSQHNQAVNAYLQARKGK